MNNIIHKNQYGFQKLSGTLSAASALVDIIQRNQDSHANATSGCVFIDLRKAFDNVPHQQLLDKLSDYGIRGIANKLIASYLNNRNQYVDINGT